MAPSWLTPNKNEAPAAPAPSAEEIQEMEKLPGVIQFMRLLNLGAAGGLIAAAVSLDKLFGTASITLNVQ